MKFAIFREKSSKRAFKLYESECHYIYKFLGCCLSMNLKPSDFEFAEFEPCLFELTFNKERQMDAQISVADMLHIISIKDWADVPDMSPQQYKDLYQSEDDGGLF